MGSYVSKKGVDSSDAAEVNNCILGYKSSLEEKVQSKVSLNEAKKTVNDRKLVLEKLCHGSNTTCKAEVKIALVNCSLTPKKLIYCEFHSIQIINYDNKTNVDGNVVINTSIHLNLEMLKTLNFTTYRKYLTASAPQIVELVSCSIVKIAAPASSTDTAATTAPAISTATPTTTSSTTTTTTTTTPTTTANTTATTTTTTTRPTTTTNSTATTTTTTTTPTTTTNSTATTTLGRKAKSKSSNGKIALVILAIFILMGVAIIACYYKYRKKLSNRPAYYNDISLNDPLHTEIKFYKADGEGVEDNAEEDDDDDILPLI